jgi:hypothetical protein
VITLQKSGVVNSTESHMPISNRSMLIHVVHWHLSSWIEHMWMLFEAIGDNLFKTCRGGSFGTFFIGDIFSPCWAFRTRNRTEFSSPLPLYLFPKPTRNFV